MTTRRVTVTMNVIVTVDRKMFTKKFMQEFRENFYNFQTIDDHIEHLGWLYLRGLVDNGSFIEGYGEEFRYKIRFTGMATDDTISEPVRTPRRKT